MRLVPPSTTLAQSHAAYVRELVERNEKFVPYVLAEVGDSFAEYVSRLTGYSRGIGLPTGHVPSSTYWLLDDADEIVAVSNLRHKLSPFLSSYGGHIGFGVRPSARRQGYASEILGQTLIEASKLGIDDVLVTCDKDNQASARTIQRNGGVLDSEEYMEAHATIIQRYWIRRP